MNTVNKNNSITLWRIVFTYLIMIFHFDNVYVIFQEFNLTLGWYIAVEFFFIVSGYLLYANLDRLSQKCHSGWDYFVYRFKKIYPFYLGAFLISLILYTIGNHIFTPKNILDILSTKYFELFAMHAIGLDVGWSNINNTSWFICIMFIAGFIIFHCLVKWKDNFINFVAPLIIIISFSYLYRYMGGLGAVVQISGVYENQPLMRGLADMCLGIFAARLNGYIVANCKKLRWIKLAGVLGFLFVILFSAKYGNSTRDFLFAIVLTVSVGIGFLPSEHKLFESKLLQYWSNITLSIYLLHDVFRSIVFPKFIGYTPHLSVKFVYMGLYLVVVTVSAVIFDALIKWLLRTGKVVLSKLV